MRGQIETEASATGNARAIHGGEPDNRYRQGLLPNAVYHMDCLEGMDLLPDRSVHMILCDLPYGITKNAWDSVIDLDRLWAAYRRIIRPRAAIVLTAQCPFDKVLGMSNRRWLRYEWIWEKTRATGFLNAKRAPLKAHENVLVFYREPPPYHPQYGKGRPYVCTRRGQFSPNYGRRIGATVSESTGLRYPRSVLRFAPDRPSVHPTQKPVALFEYLVRTYTNRGDIVLDHCIGSGTTAIACLNAGRQFIGFERDAHFFDVAVKRIAARCDDSATVQGTPPQQVPSVAPR